MNDAELKRRNYIEEMNHAPYGVIILATLGFFCLFTFLILLGVF